ncbi:hypothetical protein [Rickettsia tamurae]|uniref:hypothetical protein n=1 Tax=Rickettsia tamurae TaxID=334545 RepID=UPI000A6CE2DC|nr:hypothetical protein [Rickettsia tamurae]
MNHELVFYFLHDLEKFQEYFQRVLDRTPNERAPSNIEFWIEFFRSMALSIQNTQLGTDLEVNDVCFSIGNVHYKSKTKVLKLAFKVSDQIILRSISIGESRRGIPDAIKYSDKEIEIIENHLFGDNARTTKQTHINLSQVDSQMLHLNIKFDTQLGDNRELGKKGSSGKDAKNMVKVRPLQLNKVNDNITFDRMLDLISNPASADKGNIEAFFSKLIELYNSNKEFGIHPSLEAGPHGFTYGLFTLIYKHKYALDTYVEQSVGKGFLDIEVIFRKMLVDQDIVITNVGSCIIGEFKTRDTEYTSAQAAIDQIKNEGYNYNLYGRTQHDQIIAVGLNFNRASNMERIQVDLSLRRHDTKSFISEIVNSNDKTEVKGLLKNIYYSIRSEELLDLVLLGNLLSQNNISNKKLFIVDQQELNPLSNTKVTIFSFKHNNKNIILTITDTDQGIAFPYDKLQHTQSALGSTRSKTRAQTQNSIPIKTTTQQELENLVIQIQKQEKIYTGQRINLIINSKATNNQGKQIPNKKFSDKDKLNSYLQDITIQDIQDHTNTNLDTLTKYIEYNCNDIEIDTGKLLYALIYSNSMTSPSQGVDTSTLVALRKLFFNTKDLIASYKEAGVKSLMHGLYLTQFKPESSLGHGRVDGIISDDNDQIVLLEFKFNVKNIVSAVQQGQAYAKYLKSVTDAKTINGIALNFNEQAQSIDDVITYTPFTGSVAHYTSDEESRSPIKQQKTGTGDDTNVETTFGAGVKRKFTSSDSPSKKVMSNIENLEAQRDNIALQAPGPSCSTRSSSKNRLKRDVCQEKENEEIFPYEPLEEGMVSEQSKINARLYFQIAYLVALEHPVPINQNIKPDNVLTYVTNIGDIISEGEINHSLREEELLQTHYQEAQGFFNKYPKDMVLELVGAAVDLSRRAWLFDNGKHSLLVSYDGHRYHVYSQDLNYRQSFQTKKGVSFTDIKLYAEAFFKWCGNSIEYDLFTLKQNIPEEITHEIKQAKFWNPDQVVSDLVLLDKGPFFNIEGIPAKVIRELFFLDGNVPELTALHENFFTKYSGRISIRVEELHHVLSLLTPQTSKSLVNLVQQHNFRVDTAYLNNMPENTQSLLDSYHNDVSNKLKTSASITIQDLSDLSWQVLEKEMIKNPEISSELRENSLKNVQELHSIAATRAHSLGITSQTLFFLPDIIRAINTGNFEGVQKTGAMILGDMAFNKMYDSLISKLEMVLTESRIVLLKRLPVINPIFKILTIHSIIELHKQLNNLPADSEEAGIIKHQLGEQYFTIGLMVGELFGLALGPLWVGLMAEQLVYGAIVLRKQYHLDIPFGEAFLMNLGFSQEKLKSILEERQLVDFNLSLVNRLSAQTNISYSLVVVKVPKMLYDEAHPGNTVVEFKPKDSLFCMEDNVFLEKNSGYKRISSVISDKPNNNCVNAAPLQISGDGLTALYGNNNSTEKQSIYVDFDPNEGDMKLHFTKEGLTGLGKLNNHQQSNSNVTSPYVVTAQIYHKPYPDQFGLFGNRNHSFILNDDSKRVVSNYYIDGISFFALEDNACSTSIKFLSRNFFERYNAYINGNTSNMQIKSISSEDTITGRIVLKNKDYLKLNLEHLLINGKLIIDIPNTEILYAKGYKQHSLHNPHIEVSHNVLNFKILLEAPSIRRINIKNKNAYDVIIHTGHFSNRPFTISLQAIHTEYKSYYTFIVDDLQPVLDEMTFTSRGFPKHFIFLCSSSTVQGWCKINNDPAKNIISIKGKQDGKDGILTIEDKKSVLELVKNINTLPQDNEHIEVVSYNNVVKLEGDLKFNQVLKNVNYNSSVYYNYINKHNFTNWNIIKFNSSNNGTTLYHFRYSDVQINDINYFIKETKIYATLKNNLDCTKLLKDNRGNPISIFVGTTLSNSQISLKEDILEINNSTVYNLSDSIIFVFQKSNGKIFPLSLRLLKDSFKYANATSHFTSLIENQINFVDIAGIILLSSSTSLEKIQIDSITYDEIIEQNPHHITNNFIQIKKHALTSMHKITLSDQSNVRHINITVNINCNTISESCATTSQYEFNCLSKTIVTRGLNNSILIRDTANSSSIVLHKCNYIGCIQHNVSHIQYNDNIIVSKVSLQNQQNLVLHNPLIYDKLTVDAKNVTILDAISIGNNGNIIVKGSTKDFKITLKGPIHITKYYDNYSKSIIRTEPGDTKNDIQLIYKYTEKNNTRIYTVKLEHINERFFQDIQVEDINKSEQLIHFGTPKTKYNWYNRDNDIQSVLMIKVELPDSKIGTLIINGTTYILNVYNQDEELVLQEIKYAKNCLSNNEDLIFKETLLNCTKSYFCHYSFSPLSNIEQAQYLNLSDVSVFWSQHYNHKVLVHHPKCYHMDESKSPKDPEYKNVVQGSSNILEQVPSRQHQLHDIDQKTLLNKTTITTKIAQQLGQLNPTIVNGLRYLLTSSIDSAVSHYCLGFNTVTEQQQFVDSKSYDKEELKRILSNSQTAATLIWLIAKSYSDALTRNPNHETSKLLADIRPCFENVIESKLIHHIVRCLEGDDIVFQVERFIKHHQQELQEKISNYLGITEQVIEIVDSSNIVDHHRHHHGENNHHHRVHRAVEENDMTSSVASSLSSSINDGCNWLKENIIEVVSNIVISGNQIFTGTEETVKNNGNNDNYYKMSEKSTKTVEDGTEDSLMATLDSTTKEVTRQEAIDAVMLEDPPEENQVASTKAESILSFEHEALMSDNSINKPNYTTISSSSFSDYGDYLKPSVSSGSSHNAQFSQVPEVNSSLLLADLIARSITGEKYKLSADKFLLSPQELIARRINDRAVQSENNINKNFYKLLSKFDDDRDSSWFGKVKSYVKSTCQFLGFVREEDIEDYIQDIRSLFSSEDFYDGLNKVNIASSTGTRVLGNMSTTETIEVY